MIEFKGMPKSDNADFIKYIAAIMVIISHSFVIATENLAPVESFFNSHIAFGAIGVSIFFFFSGFLIAQSILRKKQAKFFFRARISKIFPPLVVVIFATVFILGPCVTELSLKKYFLDPVTYKYIFNIVLIRHHRLPGVFESNPYPDVVNGSLWTLPLEFLCYIATYVIYKFRFLRKGYILIPVPFVCLMLMLLSLLGEKAGVPIGYLGAIMRPCICYYMGLIMFFYKEYWINSRLCFLSFILLVVGLLQNSVYVLLIFILPVFLLNICWGISISVNCRLAKLGKYSYGIYLVAFPIQQLQVWAWGEMNPLINAAIAIILSTMLGKMIYRYIELPIIIKGGAQVECKC